MGSVRRDRAGDASEGLPATLHLGAVRLTVADLERSLEFYVEVLGFRVHRRQGNEAYLGVGGEDMLVLTESPGAPPRPRDTTGLYHYAILQPDRVSLARSLRRLVDKDYPLWGASDHLVSEALYLDDPDGNGIEIYRDRPRDTWRWRENLVEMDTRRLDLGGLLKEPGAGEPWEGLPAGASIGHVHLHVRDLAEAERFYHGVLGFDVVARYGGQALFVSAGGYHHHVGLNTWAGAGAPPPPDGSAGLRLFEIHLPEPADLEKVVSRLREAGTDFEEQPNAVFLRDHSRNGIRITSEDAAQGS
ncbi:glyoxalase [Rubrobacter tropicus]|uniref:Glyoxalase n=1 Tax=Rubrobacter tropicus TaxID=2653851 RepID=A0A6G8Q566_9ACTN|nr:VOC family protein [Rubrobacter tropicus]QIN81559.1 glyoxalase [Rubrobacter tropicus]